MRLKLAEAHSEQESSEKRWRCQAEEEAERIHSKYVAFSIISFYLANSSR